ncbi:MAG: TIGR04282 family arsenosugar biosynthesis glycosyltransferase [Acidobacteriota bacterium]
MPPVILLFAKAPIPGQVKTRLQPLLNADQCAELHASFVADALHLLSRFNDRALVELHTDSPTAAWPHCPFPRRLQSGLDLGQRMWHAAHGAFSRGASQVLLLGSDAPTLPPAHLDALLASPADLAFGPTEDGGYYAVMFRRLPPALFDHIEWSTENTLAHSLAQAARLGLHTALGPPWFDIDSPADLLRLAAADPPPHTRAWLAAHQFLVTPTPAGI